MAQLSLHRRSTAEMGAAVELCVYLSVCIYIYIYYIYAFQTVLSALVGGALYIYTLHTRTSKRGVTGDNVAVREC